MRKIEDIEKDIVNHLIAIHSLCEESGRLEFFNCSVCFGSIDWFDSPEITEKRMRGHLFKEEIERMKSDN